MKAIKTLLIIGVSTLIIYSCGTADSKESKQSELEQYKSELAELQQKIDELESELTPTEDNGNLEVLVSPITINPATFVHQIEVRGAVESRRNVMISAETMGRVEKIYVNEGESVKSGQVLIEMDADVLRNNIAEIETSLELAVAVFERQKNLWDRNIGTEIQFLQAKNSKEALERRLETLKSQLEQFKITAPFSGTVDDIPIRVGEIAQPGLPLVRILNPRDMYIKADVSEAYLSKFRIDDEVEVIFPIQNINFKSSISSISKVINPENRTFAVEVVLPPASDFEYQPNQVVIVNMTDYENEGALSVPTRLIQTDGAGKYVYVVSKNDDGTYAEKARVKVGLTFNSRTEILEGIESGDQVINEGFREVSSGSEVRLVASKF